MYNAQFQILKTMLPEDSSTMDVEIKTTTTTTNKPLEILEKSNEQQVEIEEKDDNKKENNIDDDNDNLSNQCKNIHLLIEALDQVELESLPDDINDNNDDDDNNIRPNSRSESSSLEKDIEIINDNDETKDSNSSFDDVEKPTPSPEQFEIISEDNNEIVEDVKIEKNEIIETSSEVLLQKDKSVIEIPIATTSPNVEIVIPKPRERKSKCLDKNETVVKSDSLTVANNSSENNKTLVNKKDYPVDLNPFGDDDDEQVGHHQAGKPKSSLSQAPIIEYPDDLNPFGDDDDTNENNNSNNSRLNTTTSSSLNPFGSESEDENDTSKNLNATTSSSTRLTPISTPMAARRRKKRPAPLPPNKSDQSLNKSFVHQQDNSMYDSFISNASSNADLTGSIDDNIGGGEDDDDSQQNRSVSQLRTPTPTPRRSKMNNKSNSSTNLAADQESTASSNSNNSVQAQLKAIKSKKRPAPPIPAFKRSLKTSTEDMDKELESIGDELPSIEQERSQLEKWLMEYKNKKEQETSINDDNEVKNDNDSNEFEKNLERFLELAKQKCKLSRKQKELMYMKRELKLEETQIELEYQLRIIMSKQDAQKTDEDKFEEQRLLAKMMEIIDERNDIIENMVQDENKEIEEYQKMISKVIPQKPEPISENSNENNETSSTEKSSKHHLKPLFKLKKLNKKLKVKIKKNDHKSNEMNNQEQQEDKSDNNNDDDKSSTASEETSSSTTTATVGDNENPTSTKIKSDKKKKDLATLSRSTLKKLKNPTKTIQNVSSEIKLKLQSHSQNNQNNQNLSASSSSSTTTNSSTGDQQNNSQQQN